MSFRSLFMHALLLSALALPGVSPLAAQTADCPGAPASILEDDVDDAVAVGARALHGEPDAQSPIVVTVPAGGVVNVLWQTVCVDGGLWRKLVYQGAVGFAPEVADGAPAFEPHVPPDPVDVSVPGRRMTQLKSDALVAEHSTALANRFVMQPQIGYSFPDAMSPTPNYILYWPDDYYIVQEHAYDPYIAIYPVGPWRQISNSVSQRIDWLQAQLAARPALPQFDSETGQRAEVIDLPYRNAAQLVRASQRYLDFENGSGIRFISYYAQMTAELGNGFVYTFNGITDDGRYFVSADFPILLPPGTLPPFDYEADLAAGEEPMNSYYVQYLEQVNLAVEALEPFQTTPSLQTLDDFVASFYVSDPQE